MGFQSSRRKAAPDQPPAGTRCFGNGGSGAIDGPRHVDKDLLELGRRMDADLVAGATADPAAEGSIRRVWDRRRAPFQGGEIAAHGIQPCRLDPIMTIGALPDGAGPAVIFWIVGWGPDPTSDWSG